MRVVFFGTPDVAVPSVDALLASSHDLIAVVTQPDRRRGRDKRESPSPVKAWAMEAGIEVLQPETPKEQAFIDRIHAMHPDVLAIVAYGHILPPSLLAVAPAMNVHFSLLPAYRGAAPVQRAVLDGVDETGVTVFFLEPTVDTGPIIGRARVPLDGTETSGDLFARLAPMGADLLVRSIDGFARDALEPIEQPTDGASRAPKIDLSEAHIDWSKPAEQIVRSILAFDPAPVAWCSVGEGRLSLFHARLGDAVPAEPGTILALDPVTVAAVGGSVVLREVQPAGKRRMPATDWARGARIQIGQRLPDASPRAG